MIRINKNGDTIHYTNDPDVSRGRYHVDQSLFKALFTEVAIYRERIEE